MKRNRKLSKSSESVLNILKNNQGITTKEIFFLLTEEDQAEFTNKRSDFSGRLTNLKVCGYIFNETIKFETTKWYRRMERKEF